MGSKKRKAASTPSAAAAAPTEEARVAALQASMDALQSWLLAAGGTIHPSLRFGNDGNGGTGCFATRLIEAETDLFVVPRQCIISLDTVRESRLGRELCDAVGALDSELADEEATEIATWIFMVTGRCDTHTHAHTHAHTHMHARTLTCTCTYTNMHMHMRWRRRRDPQHGYHAYLASLPAVPDDVACWPAAHRGGGLEATPVAGEVQQAVDLAECHACWKRRLGGARSHSFVWHAQPPWADGAGRWVALRTREESPSRSVHLMGVLRCHR